jgi:hypothetical protein
MSSERKNKPPAKVTPEPRDLELNRETLQDLTELETKQVQGGGLARTPTTPCTDACSLPGTQVCGA